MPSHYYGVKANGATVDVVNDYPLLADYFTDGVLPNFIDKFVQGGNTAGTEIGAGLPNISGSILRVMFRDATAFDGCFSIRSTDTVLVGNNTTTAGGIIDFSASNSSSIYGNSATVQPPARTAIPYICYA